MRINKSLKRAGMFGGMMVLGAMAGFVLFYALELLFVVAHTRVLTLNTALTVLGGNPAFTNTKALFGLIAGGAVGGLACLGMWGRARQGAHILLGAGSGCVALLAVTARDIMIPVALQQGQEYFVFTATLIMMVIAGLFAAGGIGVVSARLVYRTPTEPIASPHS